MNAQQKTEQPPGFAPAPGPRALFCGRWGRETSLGKAGSTREAEVFPKERSVLAPLKSIFHFLSIGVFLRSHLHVVKRRDPKCLVRELCLWDDHSVHCSTSPPDDLLAPSHRPHILRGSLCPGICHSSRVFQNFT